MRLLSDQSAPLTAGDTLTWHEFARRWDSNPEIKFAELIGGKVYMPPPLSFQHGSTDSHVNAWLSMYAAATPGCNSVINATCRMLKDAPQPDAFLCIGEDFGGQSRVRGKYLHGAPELIAEVCASSATYDLHEKMELYRRAGVQEFLAVLVYESEIRHHRLAGRTYKRLRPARDGIIRSTAFPGLWLNVRAMLDDNLNRVLATLNRGLASAEHARFADLLNRRRRR